MIRGINVGGRRPIRMDELRALYEGLGYSRILTYLQSGNVIFASAEGDGANHASAIEGGLREACGLEVDVAVTASQMMAAAVRANPLLGRRGVDPKFLHATFLVRPSGKPSLKGVQIPLGPGEEAVLVGSVVYLYCPNGYGSTKINNAFFERRLSARATTRSWKTVTALEKLARGDRAAS
jgi:uncharacterized protein (DUF1697 family)